MVMSLGSDLWTRLGSFPVSVVIMTKSALKEKKYNSNEFQLIKFWEKLDMEQSKGRNGIEKAAVAYVKRHY